MIKHRSSDGFTIVEIAVVVPILMVIVLSLFSIMLTFLISSNREQARLNQSFSQASALDRIETDVRLSTNYLNQLDATVSDPTKQLPSNAAWNFAGTSADNRVLILREIATTGNPSNPFRQPIFKLSSSGGSCFTSSDISGKLTYNIIYFVYNSTLYRRVATDRTTPRCNTQYQKQSCPDAATMTAAGQTRDAANCQANDEVIARNVAKFNVSYFSTQTDTVPLDTYTNASLLDGALSVNIIVGNSQRAYGGSVATESALRTTTSNKQSPGAL